MSKKNKKMICRTYDLVIYPREVIVVKNPNIRTLEKQYMESNGSNLTITEDDKNSLAVVIRCRRVKDKHIVYLVILFNGKDNILNTAAHEATHIWKMIKDELGIYVNIDAQECDAYPIGCITEWIYNTWKMK